MSVKRNVIANYLGSGWAALMGMAFLPLYIRYLGIESYGLVGFFVTLQVWLSLLDMGLSPTLNREMARFSAGQHTPQSIRDLLKSMEVVYSAVATLLALLVAGISSWLASDWLKLQTLSVDTVSHALAIMGVVISLQWMDTLYRSALLGLQHQVWLSLVTASIATLRATGTIVVLAFVSPTITAFFAFQCVVSMVETVLLGWYVRRSLPRAPLAPKFSLDALRNVWRFAAGLTVITFLATLLTQVDKLLLAKLLPLDQFGYFSLAVTVAGALQLLISPINNTAFPRLTELVATGNETALADEYHWLAQILSIATLPAALVLCIFSEEIIWLWTRDKLTADTIAPIVSVWVIGTALNGLMHIPYAAQLAHGWANLTIIVNTIAVTIMIPSMIFFVPKHGAIAAAWIWVAINFGYIVFSIWTMHTRILKREKWKWYIEDVIKPLAAGVAATLTMSSTYRLIGETTRTTQLALIITTIIIATLAAASTTPLGRGILKKLLQKHSEASTNEPGQN